jgi:hypothetical protein
MVNSNSVKSPPKVGSYFSAGPYQKAQFPHPYRAMAVESKVDGTSDDMESTMRGAAMVLPPGSDSGAQAVREGHQ